MQQMAMNVELSSISSVGETETGSDADNDSDPPQTPSQPKPSRPTNVVSPGLAAALDRTKVTEMQLTSLQQQQNHLDIALQP